MQEFLIYLLGWVVFIICHYIYWVYINKDGSYTYKYNRQKNKKLILYNGLKWGVFSWVGLIFCIVAFIVGAIIYGILEIISLDEYIEDKLKNE